MTYRRELTQSAGILGIHENEKDIPSQVLSAFCLDQCWGLPDRHDDAYQ
jgi:antirestriction protein ArdC